MKRFALPAVAVVSASLLAPAASAAMEDDYTPHFDSTPRYVEMKPSDGYTETTEYELLGVPEGTTWKLTGENTLRKKGQLFGGENNCEDKPLGARLNNYTLGESPQPGENVIDFDIRVCFPDGSQKLYPQKIALTSDDAFYYNPNYGKTVTADPGQTFTVTPTNEFEAELPTNAKWKITGGDGWNAHIDQTTGAITATVPKDTSRGTTFTVVSTFADGSTRKSTAHVANSGKGVEAPAAVPAPAPQPAQDGAGGSAGSSTAQKLALVSGVLAVLLGAVAFAWPQLQQFLPQV